VTTAWCPRTNAAPTSRRSRDATSRRSSAARTPRGGCRSAIWSRPSTTRRSTGSVLDMLAPWECLDAVSAALVPGGRGRVLPGDGHAALADGRGTPGARDLHGTVGLGVPVRGWHLEGLAVRPQHRMVGHTGFLVTARRLADGVPPPPRRRPAGAWRVRRGGDGPAGETRPGRRSRCPGFGCPGEAPAAAAAVSDAPSVPGRCSRFTSDAPKVGSDRAARRPPGAARRRGGDPTCRHIPTSRARRARYRTSHTR
jgi:tRNA (adenine57-N1/adenine58-N1)-methyltransferase